MHGKFRAINTGVPFHMTPSETTAKGIIVPPEVSEDPKGYGSAIVTIANVDDLYIEHAESKNFVSTIAFLSSISSGAAYSKNVKVDYTYGEEQWVTILGGGFKTAEFESVIGKNMVWSQGDNPNHVLYLGISTKVRFNYTIFAECVINKEARYVTYL